MTQNNNEAGRKTTTKIMQAKAYIQFQNANIQQHNNNGTTTKKQTHTVNLSARPKPAPIQFNRANRIRGIFKNKNFDQSEFTKISAVSRQNGVSVTHPTATSTDTNNFAHRPENNI